VRSVLSERDCFDISPVKGREEVPDAWAPSGCSSLFPGEGWSGRGAGVPAF